MALKDRGHIHIHCVRIETTHFVGLEIGSSTPSSTTFADVEYAHYRVYRYGNGVCSQSAKTNSHRKTCRTSSLTVEQIGHKFPSLKCTFEVTPKTENKSQTERAACRFRGVFCAVGGQVDDCRAGHPLRVGSRGLWCGAGRGTALNSPQMFLRCPGQRQGAERWRPTVFGAVSALSVVTPVVSQNLLNFLLMRLNFSIYLVPFSGVTLY